jgi:PAS domain-containing protein
MYEKGDPDAQPSPLEAGAAEQGEPLIEVEGARERLQESLALVRATLQSTADGILVVRRGWSIADYNDRFVEMWRVPPGLLAAGHDNALVAHVLDQVAERDHFLKLIEFLQEKAHQEMPARQRHPGAPGWRRVHGHARRYRLPGGRSIGRQQDHPLLR